MTRIDHAIFTSMQSMTGQGYRIVACSPGVTADEKKVIAQSSPSHDAMSDPSDEAEGLAFYQLGEDRFCIARSCHAGREQTARGGSRVLTDSFVLDGEGLHAFGWNPFAVLRALGRIGAFTVDARHSDNAEVLEVDAEDDSEARTVEHAFEILSAPEVMYLLDRSMRAGCLILPGMLARASALMEGIFLALPTAMRGGCSFSIGLKFTLSRRRRFVLIGADPTKAQRLTRGQQFTVVHDLAAKAATNAPTGLWMSMVSDCYRCHRLDDLLDIEKLSFDGLSIDDLDEVAQRQIDLNHVGEMPTDALLEALWPVEVTADSQVERVLNERFVGTARELAFGRLRVAPHEELERHWPVLLSLSDVDEAVGQLCLDLHARTPTLEPAPPGAETVASTTPMEHGESGAR